MEVRAEININDIDKRLLQIENFVKNARRHSVTSATNKLHDEVKKNISMEYHTKYELMMLGYPFAAKDGFIKPHGHMPLWSVHLKDGNFLKGLDKQVTESGYTTTGTIGWFSPGYIDVLILYGSEKRIERPVLRLTAEEIGIREFMLNEFRSFMGTK